ncbi:MAG: TldD/PmbA family protein [Candidatus Thorarchaeota archaeon]|nr:TldD/PmbA family protein [Candidatus Thorarchaeota archaeon]
MTGEDMLLVLVDAALDRAKSRSKAAIAEVVHTRTSQIRFSQNAVDVVTRWDETKMNLFVDIDGKKTSITSVAVSSADDVRRLVDETIDFSKRLPDSMFYQGVEDRVSSYSQLEMRVDDRIDDFTEKAPGIISSAIDAALTEGAKRVAGALAFGKTVSVMRSSLGPSGTHRETSYDLNVRAFQEELDYSGQGLSCGTMPTRAEKEMREAGAQAGRLSKQARGARQGDSGTYDVVMSPTVAANVIGQIVGTANPFMVLIGMSPLGDRIGQKMAPDFVTAAEDPHFPGGLASRAYDFEGTPTRKTLVFDKGVLKGFIHNTTTARMFDTVSTGNSAVVGIGHGASMLLPNDSNIVFEAGDHSLEELLESNRRTIYVMSNWYTRWQNHQTTDFSTIPRDAIFLIEHGDMKPIKNIRISDNQLRMLANITALGKERKQVYWWEVSTPTVIPAMRIADCRITTATK